MYQLLSWWWWSEYPFNDISFVSRKLLCQPPWKKKKKGMQDRYQQCLMLKDFSMYKLMVQYYHFNLWSKIFKIYKKGFIWSSSKIHDSLLKWLHHLKIHDSLLEWLNFLELFFEYPLQVLLLSPFLRLLFGTYQKQDFKLIYT